MNIKDNDVNINTQSRDHGRDELIIPQGFIIMSKAKQLKSSLNVDEGPQTYTKERENQHSLSKF